jgi:hypothetical protein
MIIIPSSVLDEKGVRNESPVYNQGIVIHLLLEEQAMRQIFVVHFRLVSSGLLAHAHD